MSARRAGRELDLTSLFVPVEARFLADGDFSSPSSSTSELSDLDFQDLEGCGGADETYCAEKTAQHKLIRQVSSAVASGR